MKKLCLILSLVALACQTKNRKVKELQPLTSKEDSILMNQAKMFFKELPARADDPNNPITASKVKLGKILFYDSRLSMRGNNSCNSCHRLDSFGVDHSATSKGDNGKQGNRNSPTVFNAALHNMQFWDGRAKTVEEQAGMPILNPDEMAIPHKGFLVDRLKNEKLYRDLFAAAFSADQEPISYGNVQKAIGAFERTLLTPSRFDSFMKGDSRAIDSTEKAGLKIFISSGCPVCHLGVGMGGESLQKFGLFTDYRTLTESRVDDQGRMRVTGKKTDEHTFKVAGLRNVEKTYPYFHDGSVANLDRAVSIMAKAQLNKTYSPEELNAVIKFLKTLTGQISEEAKRPPAELPVPAIAGDQNQGPHL